MSSPDTISVGRNPEPIADRDWALHKGNSGIQWVEPDHPRRIALQEPPVVDTKYELQLLGNFHGTRSGDHLFMWVPPLAFYNGFDESNAAELEQIRFYFGTIEGYDSDSKSLSFLPTRFVTPYELAEQAIQSAPLTDTVFVRQCSCLRHNRLRWVEFSLEGNVSCGYLLVDNNLVMLDFNVWNDHHFWIGHAAVEQPELQFND